MFRDHSGEVSASCGSSGHAAESSLVPVFSAPQQQGHSAFDLEAEQCSSLLQEGLIVQGHGLSAEGFMLGYQARFSKMWCL